MSRTWLKIDADGYRNCQEPGFYYSISGRDFARQLTPDPKKPGLYNHSFFVPPGLDWVLPMPRQFDPEFYKDSRLDQHVMLKAQWTFATGVVAREFELSKKADGTTFPKNKWIQVARIPTGVTSLDATNYSALATAAGFSTSVLSSHKTIAMTSTTPVGAPLTTPGYLFTPMAQWSAQPAPDDVLVFGFSNMALILAGDTISLCRSPNNDKQTWELLARFDHNQQHGGYENPNWLSQAFGVGLSGVADHDIRLRMFKSVLVGFNHLSFFVGQGAPPPVQLSNSKTPIITFPPGPWWWGAAPGQKFWTQTQIVGYESASTTFAVTAGKPLILWNLGANYKPTVDPARAVTALVHSAWSPSDLAGTDLGGIVNYSSALTGNQVQYSVSDESGNVLVGDGTHYKGGFALSLIPGTPGGLGGAYLAPQAERLSLKFEAVLVDRDNDELVLSDADFEGWRAEVSREEPNGKRAEFYLKKSGAAAFFSGGHHRRGNYPIEVWEDTDNDNVPDTVRLRAWVVKGQLKKLAVRSDDGSVMVREFVLHAVGLLHRVDRKPAYLPQLVDPLNGNQIKHTYAAREAFLSSGFDTDLDSFVHVVTDPLTGTGWEYLPDAGVGASAGKKDDASYRPRWDETWLQYIDMLARKLVGWVVFETLADVWYCPDVDFVLANGGTYFRSATIYRNQANALAAGMDTRQCYLVGGEEETDEPRGNRVRIVPKDYDNELSPWVLDSHALAVTDRTDENFTGDFITLELVPEQDADMATAQRAARVALILNRRRKFLRPVEVAKLAPWQLDGPGFVDAGYIAELEANAGPSPDDSLIVHMEVEQVTSRASGSFYKTRLIGEKVPLGATAGNLADVYPGGGQVL